MSDDRISSTTRALESAASSAGMWISGDGRVTEADAAALLGLAPGTLANLRGAEIAPTHYRTGRVTYRIADLAHWIEAHRAVRIAASLERKP